MEASDCGKDGTKGFPGSARRLLGSQANPLCHLPIPNLLHCQFLCGTCLCCPGSLACCLMDLLRFRGGTCSCAGNQPADGGPVSTGRNAGSAFPDLWGEFGCAVCREAGILRHNSSRLARRLPLCLQGLRPPLSCRFAAALPDECLLPLPLRLWLLYDCRTGLLLQIAVPGFNRSGFPTRAVILLFLGLRRTLSPVLSKQGILCMAYPLCCGIFYLIFAGFLRLSALFGIPELRPQLFRAIVQPSPQQFLWRGDGFFFDVPS